MPVLNGERLLHVFCEFTAAVPSPVPSLSMPMTLIATTIPGSLKSLNDLMSSEYQSILPILSPLHPFQRKGKNTESISANIFSHL